MRQPRRMLIALVLSVPLWLAIATGIWLTSQAFHITFPFQASFLVTTVLVVGVAVPTPGAVGGFHLAYQFAAVVLLRGAGRIGPPARRSCCTRFRLCPVTLLGIYFMARDGLTLAGAQRMAAERRKEEERRRRSGASGDDGARARAPPIGREAEGRAR